MVGTQRRHVSVVLACYTNPIVTKGQPHAPRFFLKNTNVQIARCNKISRKYILDHYHLTLNTTFELAQMCGKLLGAPRTFQAF